MKVANRGLIVTPDYAEFTHYPLLDLNKELSKIRKFSGIMRTVWEDDFTLPVIQNYYHNGMVLFDDCRAYFTSSLDKELHKFLIRRRQNMLDIIAVAHGFTEVPPKFFTFATEIILFRTLDNIYSRKYVIQDFERVKKAQAEVNRISERDEHYFQIIKY